MKFLFSHRNFPAQFRHVLNELAKDSANDIVFITGTKNNVEIKNVKKIVYNLKREIPSDCHRYIRTYEESIIHGQAAAEVAIFLKSRGFIPDVIYAHPWGNSMFFKDIFPDTPLINFCEWYYNSKNCDIDFGNKKLNEDTLAKNRCKNAQLLIDLVACDKGICPTYWQKSQFPKEFHKKIEVLHDGIDCNYFTPNDNAIFKIPGSDIILTKNDNVVTYATRGMEEYRGFPQFMSMVEKLLKIKKDVHVVIGGEDRICYGPKLPNNKTYKELMLEKLDLDLSKIHFTGGLPYGEYKKLLQVSSVHVYLTYPFVLSWSLLEAMSCECLIIGSNTAPVQEVIKDNYNGLLVDFFNVDAILEKVNYALNHQGQLQNIKKNARKTVVEKYDLNKLLIQHINIIKSLTK